MNKKWISWVLVFVSVAFTIFGVVNTNSISQNNPETLFMNAVQRINLANYDHLVHSKQILVVKVSPHKMNREQLSKFVAILDGQSAIFPQIKIKTWKDFLPQEMDSMNPKDVLDFYQYYPEMQGQLLGPEFLAAIILLPLDADVDQRDLLVNGLEELLKKDFEHVYMAGVPYVNFELNNYSKFIGNQLFPLTFALCLLLILIFTQSIRGTISIFVPSLLAAILCKLYLKYTYHHMNMITSIVPLMIFILNISLGFHLYFSMLRYRTIRDVFKQKVTPIALMLVTTTVGFGSLMLSPIEVIQNFGFSVALMLVISSLGHMLWAWISYEGLLSSVKMAYPPMVEKLINLFAYQIQNKGKLLLLCAMGLLAGFFTAGLIPIQTQAVDYFPKSSKAYRGIKEVQKTVLGNPNLEILLQRNDKAKLRYEDYEKINILESNLKEILGAHQLISLNRAVTDINQLMTGAREFPLDAKAYFDLADIAYKKMDVQPLESHYTLTLLGPSLSTEEYDQLLQRADEVFSNSGLSYSFNGAYYTLRMSQKSLIDVLAKSLFGSLAIILILSAFYFKDRKFLLMFSFVNLAPLMTSFILVYLMGLSFNIATVMTYSISLGMVVDGTFHLAHAIRKGEKEQDYRDDTLRPIILSTLVFLIAFAFFGFFEFIPVKEFGLCLFINLLLGLLYDAYVFPILVKNETKI